MRYPCQMTRRAFLASSAALAAQGTPSINAARLRQRLEQLSAFGRPAGGSFADGVTRVAFTGTLCRRVQVADG